MYTVLHHLRYFFQMRAFRNASSLIFPMPVRKVGRRPISILIEKLVLTGNRLSLYTELLCKHRSKSLPSG